MLPEILEDEDAFSLLSLLSGKKQICPQKRFSVTWATKRVSSQPHLERYSGEGIALLCIKHFLTLAIYICRLKGLPAVMLQRKADSERKSIKLSKFTVSSCCHLYHKWLGCVFSDGFFFTRKIHVMFWKEAQTLHHIGM